MVLAHHDFAQALGFSDFEALMEASESIRREGDIDWYVTALPNGRWAAWDDSELSLDRVEFFLSREAAVQYHLEAARSAGMIVEE